LTVKTTAIEVDFKNSSLCAVRYAAYAASGRAHVFLRPLRGGRVRVEFSPKPGERVTAAELSRAFRLELADEKLRERVSEENRGLREFLTLKGLNFQPRAVAQPQPLEPPRQPVWRS